MSVSLNAVQAPDSYDYAARVGVIQDLPVKRIIIDTSNNGIYWQLKKESGGTGTGDWEASETYMIPGSRVINERRVLGIRIRAAIPFASLPAGSLRAIVTVRVIT